MDRFRTLVEVSGSPVKLNYQSKSLWMGSCFTDSMGRNMEKHKFPVLINPFGTLFNPGSIANNILRLVSGNLYKADELYHHNGLWFSLNHYTGFSHEDRDTCLNTINHSLLEASSWLKQCDYLVLTFGTAKTYRFNETGEIAANCHKLPASGFTPLLSRTDEIIAQYNLLFQQLKLLNPSIRILFTLSPVRHWSDGAVQNQLSKSILHISIQELVKNHPFVFYFPAYEIFMDELRDYRFYATDMLHPSETGIDYVWERFCEALIDAPSQKIMAGVTAVLKAVGHRPRHTDTTNHKKFIQNTRKLIYDLSAKYPFLDFTNEIALLPL